MHKKSVIHGFIKNSLDKRILKIHVSGDQLRDFIDAESVSKYFFKILFKKKNKLIIEICSGRYTSVNNLKILINKISGKKIILNTLLRQRATIQTFIKKISRVLIKKQFFL